MSRSIIAHRASPFSGVKKPVVKKPPLIKAVNFKTRPVMNKSQTLTFFLMRMFGYAMTISFAVWWFNPVHVPENFEGNRHLVDFALFGLLSYVIWYQIISELHSWMISKDMRKVVPMRPKQGQRVAFVTAFVPSKEPYDILENTLRAMVAAKYEHDTWVLDEGNDPIAKEICKRLGVHHFSRKGKAKYNTAEGKFKARTKGGNHNAWHDTHGSKYDIVAQIDVDFVPRKDFLTKTIGYFKDPKVAFVGTPQIYGNGKDSWIAEGSAQQAYGFYGSTQRGLFGKNMHLFIGANHIVRTAALEDIDGYPGHIVEDHLTGMYLYQKGWKSVYVPEKLAVGEGPSTWEAYFSQQLRWAYGLIDILYKHSPRILPKMKLKHALNYFFLQQHYFYGIVQVIGITLMTMFFVSGITATSMAFAPLILLYVPLIGWQLVISLWLQQFNVDPKNESGLLLRGRLLTLAAWPVYFLAFFSIVTKKSLTYAVTPKGSQQSDFPPLTVFLPHFIIGTITGLGLVLGILKGSEAPMLMFWAAVTTLTMYGLVIYVTLQRVTSFIFNRQPEPTEA